MSAAAPFGAFPYGSSGGVEVPDYEAMLSGSDDLVLTVRLALWDIAGDVEEVRYYASAEWATTPTEVPGSLPFEDRLTSYSFGRSIINDRIGGLARGQGQVILNNADGALDDIGIDYAADGREIEIRVGRRTDPWWQHLTVLKGVTVDAVPSEDALTIEAQDISFMLDVPLQANIYSGGGSTELVSNGTFDTDLSGWTAANWSWDAGSAKAAVTIGSEKVTNGTFNSSLTGWTVSPGGSWTWFSGYAETSAAAGTLSQAITTVDGTTYQISFTPKSGPGSCTVKFGGVALGTFTFDAGPQVFYAVASGTSNLLEFVTTTSGGFPRGIDSVSVKDVVSAILEQDVTVTPTGRYIVAADIANNASGLGVSVRLEGVLIGALYGNGSYSFDVEASDDPSTLRFEAANPLLDDVTIDNVSVAALATSDLRGRRKPLTFGLADGVPPALVSGSLLIYQVHDRDVRDGLETEVTAVYDRGIALTPNAAVATYDDLEGSAPASGEFTSSLDGYFRLGAAPDGVVFATVQSYLSGATELTSVDVISAALSRHDVISDDEIDHVSFDLMAVDSALAYVGLHVGSTDAVSVSDLIDDLSSVIGGWAAFNRRGKLALGIFATPSGAPVASFVRDAGDIITIAGETMPPSIWPPPWRVRVAYQWNYTVFDDFAGSVSGEVKALYAEPYRLAETSNATVLADHLSAQDIPPVEAYYRVAGVATAEAVRLLALYSSGYRLYRLTVDRRGLLLEIGDLISVTYPRFGLESGKLMRVCAIDDRIDLTDGGGVPQVEIVAFG